MKKLTDNSLMPYGKHKGEKMANIPAAYLLFLDSKNMTSEVVQEYINENRDVLKSEVQK